MAKEDEEDRKCMTGTMSLSNLADKLKAQIMMGPAIPLNPESKTPIPEKSAEEPPKQ